MGAFKTLLPFPDEGRTVLGACVENLRAAGVGETVVVVGHRAEEVRARMSDAGLKFALNDARGSEMGVSIARGVESVSTEAEAVLIALVDQPAIPPAAIESILAARAETGARLIVPEWGGRGGHPVLVDLAFRETLLHLDAQHGLRALFDAHRKEVLRLPVGSPYVARDMDTWEDYRALYAEVFGRFPSQLEPQK